MILPKFVEIVGLAMFLCGIACLLTQQLQVFFIGRDLSLKHPELLKVSWWMYPYQKVDRVMRRQYKEDKRVARAKRLALVSWFLIIVGAVLPSLGRVSR